MVEEKYCSGCKMMKPFKEFHKCNSSKSGLQYRCKRCRWPLKKIQENLPEGLKRCCTCKEIKDVNEFVKDNKRKDGKYRQCKICKRNVCRKYTENNIEKIREKNRQYFKDNKEEILKKSKAWYRKHQEYYKKYSREWEERNRDKRRKYARDAYYRDRIGCIMRSLICDGLKKNGGSKNYRSTWKMVPYTKEELKKHIESQFDEHMNWDNWGSYWHLDHILPRSYFKYTTYKDEQFQECWALKNLRPLEKIENLKKGNKVLYIKEGN